MSSVSEIQMQQRVIIPGQLSSDTDTHATSSSRRYRRCYTETISETTSTLSSSSITTTPESSDAESISSLELSPPQITIEVLENAQGGIEDYLGDIRESETASEGSPEDLDSDDSAVEYQDVDIYTDEASDGGSLEWDERASISDTDAVYSFEEFDEEL